MTAAGRVEQDRRQKRTRRGGARAGREASPLAALDLGTNNCRLLIAEPRGDDFEVIDAFSRAVRLGEGVSGSNLLSETAQTRAIKALRICAGKIRHHRARHMRIVATEACRRAQNGPAFIERAAKLTGLRLDIISAEEEARLAVAGCAPLIEPTADQLLVFDIGGGSTELIWIDLGGIDPEERGAVVRGLSPFNGLSSRASRAAGSRITDWISVPMGVSTLCDQVPGGAGDERARCTAMAGLFEEALAPFAPYRAEDRDGLTRGLQIIGVSGTATTFGALHLGLQSYDRSRVDGLWLPRDRVDAIAARLLDLGPEGRATHPGIGRGRAELLLAGAAIMTTILRLWPVGALRVADRGLREGMLYGLLQSRRG